MDAHSQRGVDEVSSRDNSLFGQGIDLHFALGLCLKKDRNGLLPNEIVKANVGSSIRENAISQTHNG